MPEPEPSIDGRVEGWKGKRDDSMAVATTTLGAWKGRALHGLETRKSWVSAPLRGTHQVPIIIMKTED